MGYNEWYADYRNENTDLIHFQSCLHQKSEFERVMSCFFSGNLLTYWFVDLLTFKIGVNWILIGLNRCSFSQLSRVFPPINQGVYLAAMGGD